MSAPAAPFVRPLYGPGDPRHSSSGPDVVAIKRGLARAGLLDWAKFDRATVVCAIAAVRALQRHAGIPATGHYGFATHEALRRTRRRGGADEWALDAYALLLLRRAARAAHKSELEVAIERGVDAALYWVVNREPIHYAQVRPFPVVDPPELPRHTDCSGFVTTVYFAAGAHDPNRRKYDGHGYTGTLISNGERVTLDELRPLDLVFYGSTRSPSPAFPVGSPTHVAVAIGGGYVASHGQESGPMKYDVDYRRDLHSARRYNLVD